jgi:hypothetical protein
MLSPRNIIYGFCRFTNPPKSKYLLSLHRSKDFDIVACFTTSQNRAGIAQPCIAHGKVKNNKGDIVSYVFEAGNEIGIQPDGSPYSFPKQTTIAFDYCFQYNSQKELINGFDDPSIVCILHQKEYINLIYAMYQSKYTPQKYKDIFEKILE